MTTLTRKQAHAALHAGGWLTQVQLETMTAIAAAESSLRVDVTGARNSNGTEDYGLLQINSMYVTGSPHWDRARLLSDPAYNAACAYALFKGQGYGAWAAYTGGHHLKYMPPTYGGPVMAHGCPAWFLVVDMQTALNAAGASPQLTADGAWGPRTQTAVDAHHAAHPIEPHVVGPVYGVALLA